MAPGADQKGREQDAARNQQRPFMAPDEIAPRRPVWRLRPAGRLHEAVPIGPATGELL
jgi:hypothetical protein